MEKKKEKFPKRLVMILRRNLFRALWRLPRLMNYATNDKLSEETKWELINEVATRGVGSSNVTVHDFGFDKLPKQSGFIMYPNHQGLFDVFGLISVGTPPFGVVIKKEAWDIFGLRQLIQTMGGLFMDREDPKQGLQVINEVAKQVKEGRNFLIFPEGTRSRNGNRLGEFKSGSFKAATKAKCPIVPVAIIDSYLPFDTPGTEPMDIQIHVLEPIEYEEYQGMKTVEIADMVKKRIEAVIEENKDKFK